MTAKCLIVACNRPSAAAMKRGLCMGCYSRAKKMVDESKTTWERLVALGLALSIDTGNPFAEAFDKATKDGEKCQS